MPKRDIDVKELQDIYEAGNVLIDPRPLMVLTMRACGATYQEIGNVFKVTKQRAEQLVRASLEEV